MKENWTYKKLTDVCDIQYGYPFDSANFSTSANDGMPLIRIRDVKDGYSNTYYKGDYPKEYIIHKGDYLVGMDGEFNIAPWKSGDALLNQRVCKVSSKSNEVSIGYLYRFLTKELKKIEDETPYVTVKHLSAKRLNQVLLPVPPIETQSCIVSELDLLQSIIDKQKAQLKELDNLAQAVFYDMFGDPVENEKGWEVKKLGDECTDMKYGTSRPSCENGKYSYLRMCNISSDGHLDLNNLKTIDVPDDEVEKCIVRYGDILFNRTNSIDLIGKTCMFDLETPMIIAGYIIRVRLSEKLESRFVSCMFNMPSMKKLLRAMAKGAVNQANINSKELASIIIPIPPVILQHSFATKIKSIEKQKAAINQSIAETQRLFDYTMDKYFG